MKKRRKGWHRPKVRPTGSRCTYVARGTVRQGEMVVVVGEGKRLPSGKQVVYVAPPSRDAVISGVFDGDKLLTNGMVIVTVS